jgi:hypothetical protein
MTLPCGEKTRYASGAAARRALDVMRTRRAHNDNGKPLRSYPCPHCNGYHLTSQDYQDNEKSKGLWE